VNDSENGGMGRGEEEEEEEECLARCPAEIIH
jgi:hypothetical protein